MSQEIIKFDENNEIFLKNSSHIKEEFQDVYYPDNKVWLSETTITDTIKISNGELNGYIENDKIRKNEILFVDHIKTDLPSSEVNHSESNNVKIENEISFADIKNEFCSELLFCNHCHEVYQDYCTKCRVFVHILNKRPNNTYNEVKELPIYMLEAREAYGYLGIFSVKVIPEDVRFGPFTGLNFTGLPLRIKGGRLMLSDDQSEHLNWMQYINHAKNIYKQNLLPFQYEDKLYYYSTRKIQAGEELLVYFGEKYDNNLVENMEMDFVPITKEDVKNVFACTFCCMGFRSKEYLAEHKAVSHSETNEMFSVEDLAQCPFCKIYLEAKEYFDHHMDYCCETNARHCVLPLREVHIRIVETRPSLRSEFKRRKHGIYTCTQCKFSTMYSADFRNHTNEHYKLKMYQCGICHRRYKTKESLMAHVEKNHIDNKGRDVQKDSTFDYSKPNIKNIEERSPHSRYRKKQCQCSKRKFQTRHKCHLKKSLTKIKHLNKGKYKCENCEFKTYYRTYLQMHTKIKHLKLKDYKCMKCEYRTNVKSNLKQHIKSKHLKLRDFKCIECEYQASLKSDLNRHIKLRHLKLWDYKCMECEYQTNLKLHLETHIKSKHLKLHDYKCRECEYQTNVKGNFERHVKSKHVKLHGYKCMECEYQTNFKSDLKVHINTKHLKLRNYKCMECECQTSFKSDLEKHIKSKLRKLSDYKCMKCEYKANRKSSLERHMKTNHIKVCDYKCMDCEYQTNLKSNLEKHIKAKHLNLWEYKCKECEHQANSKSHLERHIKAIHLKVRDYKYEKCEYKTGDKSNLEQHIKTIHLKIKDYKCAECEYKTNYKSHLEKHVKRIHLKINDYKCAVCEYKTNNKSTLGRHIKTIHFQEHEHKPADCPS